MRRRTGLVAIALLVALAGGQSERAGAAFFGIGTNGKIVFVSNRDGDNEIFVMNADGTGVVQLTANTVDDRQPSFSPDGARIAFSRFDGADYEIFVMDADGTDVVQLTSNTASDTDPDWTASATKIVFTTDRDGNNEVYIMNVDGSSQTNRTSDAGADSAPAGTTTEDFYFQTNREGDVNVWLEPSAAPSTAITTNVASDSEPDISASGPLILFTSTRDAGNNEIYSRNLATTAETRLTNDAVSDSQPSFSPDGNKVVFTSTRDGGDNEIVVMNADGSSPVNLTNNTASDFEADWGPDGGFARWPTCGAVYTKSCVSTLTVGGGAAPAGLTLEVGSLFGSLQPQFRFNGDYELIGGGSPITTETVISLTLNVDTFDTLGLVGTGLIDSFSKTTAVTGNTATMSFRPRNVAWSNTTAFGPTSVADIAYTGMVIAAIFSPVPPPGLTAEEQAVFDTFIATFSGGWVATNAQQFGFPTYNSVTEAVEVSLSGPHFTPTLGVNTGFFRAFVPTAVLTTLFGISDPGSLSGTLVISQTESGVTTTVTATVTSVAGGVLIDVPTFSYSSPTFGIEPNADLSVSQTGPSTGRTGDGLSYTATVRNDGPGKAVEVTLTAPAPSGTTLVSATASQGSCSGSTCQLGAIATGATAQVTLVVKPALEDSAFELTSSVTSARPDPDSADRQATTRTFVSSHPADVGVSGTGPDTTAAGQRLTYRVTATNNGPGGASDVGITATLPAGATLVSATPSQGSCSGTQTVACPLGTLAKGASATVDIVLTAPQSGVIAIPIGIGARQADPNMGNQRIELRTTVTSVPGARPPGSTAPSGPVGPRPQGVPKRIPQWAWALAKWHNSGKVGKRPAKAPPKVPQWYWRWRAWRLGRG